MARTRQSITSATRLPMGIPGKQGAAPSQDGLEPAQAPAPPPPSNQPTTINDQPTTTSNQPQPQQQQQQEGEDVLHDALGLQLFQLINEEEDELDKLLNSWRRVEAGGSAGAERATGAGGSSGAEGATRSRGTAHARTATADQLTPSASTPHAMLESFSVEGAPRCPLNKRIPYRSHATSTGIANGSGGGSGSDGGGGGGSGSGLRGPGALAIASAATATAAGAGAGAAGAQGSGVERPGAQGAGGGRDGLEEEQKEQGEGEKEEGEGEGGQRSAKRARVGQRMEVVDLTLESDSEPERESDGGNRAYQRRGTSGSTGGTEADERIRNLERQVGELQAKVERQEEEIAVLCRKERDALQDALSTAQRNRELALEVDEVRARLRRRQAQSDAETAAGGRAEEDARVECSCCWGPRPDRLLVCRHVLCEPCVMQLSSCPQCRAPISASRREVTRIFLS